MIIKKIASVIGITAILLSVPVTAKQISTPAGLDSIRYNLSGTYELVNDITIDELFTPIGTRNNPFTGTFNGNGKVIRGLHINLPNNSDSNWAVGLFGVIGAKGEVKNVGVTANAVIGHYAAGVLAGINNGTIEGCYTTGSNVSAHRPVENNAGGLVGVNGGRISKSYSTANLYNENNNNIHSGGLVGLLTGGEISNSYATGSIMGVKYAGGLVGYIFGGKIIDSYSTGYVGVKSGGRAGGLIGGDLGDLVSWNTQGKNPSTNYVEKAVINNSYWDTQTSKQSSSAGGRGLSTSNMMNISSYTGWNSDNTWTIRPGAYPLLSGISSGTVVYMSTNGGKILIESKPEPVDTAVITMGVGVSTPMLIAAVCEPGYEFAVWSDGRTNFPRSDVVTGDTLFLTAIFVKLPGEPDTPDIPKPIFKTNFVYLSGTGGKLMAGGTGESSVYFRFGNIEAGSRGPLVAAVPNSGFRFAGWDDNSPQSGNLARFDKGINDRDATITLTARFAPITESPIKISNLADLRKIGKDNAYPLNGNYELTNYIDIDDNNFEPIGTPDNPFTGIFRGKGEETAVTMIDGLNLGVKRPDGSSDFIGLFGYTKGAMIIGVHIEMFDTEGKNSIGTLAGMSVSTYIDSSGSVGGTVLSGGGMGAGGLIGSCSSSIIIRSYSNSGAKNADIGAGGLIGAAFGSMITQSYSTWNANAREAAGGLVGLNDGGAVQFCYSTGTAHGTDGIGGLVGKAPNGGVIFQSYSSGAAGIGLTGSAAADSVKTSYYWSTEASGLNQLTGGFGVTSSNMMKKSTFNGWDFNTVWNIDEEKSFPYLREMEPFAGNMPGLLFKTSRQTSALSKAKPFVTVKGRVITINAPANEILQVKVINLRGKTIAQHNITGGTKIPITKIPAGSYIVEVRERNKKMNVSRIVVR